MTESKLRLNPIDDPDKLHRLRLSSLLNTTENLSTKPSQEEIQSIRIGDFVKVATESQRFWVRVSTTGESLFQGVVDNKTGIPLFDLNDKIEFNPENIYSILLKEDDHPL
jgi:hypothetical protein